MSTDQHRTTLSINHKYHNFQGLLPSVIRWFEFSSIFHWLSQQSNYNCPITCKCPINNGNWLSGVPTLDDTKSHYQLVISITIFDCKCVITCKCPINALIGGLLTNQIRRNCNTYGCEPHSLGVAHVRCCAFWRYMFCLRATRRESHFQNLSRGKSNPFIPKSDQCQNSPAASPEILHDTVRRIWLSIAYSDWKMIIVPIVPHLYISLFKEGRI